MKDKLRIAIVGLGRLGKEYLKIISQKCKSADLVSACSLDAGELEFAKKMGIKNIYFSYDEMLKKGGFEALFIITPSDLHPDYIMKALDAGYHIFCEKPLGVDLESCLAVEKCYQKHLDKILMVGFVRRFDDSYLYAMEKIEKGVVGKPFFVRSQTVDHYSIAPFQLKFMQNSGSIYLDYNVHDIDLVRWFLQSEVTEVYSIGGAYKYKEFADYNSMDNTMSNCKLADGSMAHIVASRTCPYGHGTSTEIWGSEGWLKIGYPAHHIQVEWGNKQGVTRECVKTFFDRFERAFQQQIIYFIDCVLQNKKPSLKLQDATWATRVALVMQESFDKEKPIKIEL